MGAECSLSSFSHGSKEGLHLPGGRRSVDQWVVLQARRYLGHLPACWQRSLIRDLKLRLMKIQSSWYSCLVGDYFSEEVSQEK